MSNIHKKLVSMYSLSELREAAFEKGIKGSYKMNLKTLCNHLLIPLVQNEKFDRYCRVPIRYPVKITFTSLDGEKIEFPSIYSAAKSIKKSSSCIPFYIKKGINIMYKGKEWTVSRDRETGTCYNQN